MRSTDLIKRNCSRLGVAILWPARGPSLCEGTACSSSLFCQSNFVILALLREFLPTRGPEEVGV